MNITNIAVINVRSASPMEMEKLKHFVAYHFEINAVDIVLYMRVVNIIDMIDERNKKNQTLV